MTGSLWERLPDTRLLVDVSLWSADLARLGDEVKRLEPYADIFHIDVTDGHFVRGLLFFPDLVAALRPLTHTPFHVHLMVEQPLTLIDDFIGAGADLLTVDCANGAAAAEAIRQIHGHGLAAGIAVDLDVDLEETRPYLDEVDLVLMMGTPLGIKGVGLAPEAEARTSEMRGILSDMGRDEVKIGADGGLRRHTVPALRAAGADLIAPGSLIFGSPDLREVFEWLWGLPKGSG